MTMTRTTILNYGCLNTSANTAILYGETLWTGKICKFDKKEAICLSCLLGTLDLCYLLSPTLCRSYWDSVVGPSLAWLDLFSFCVWDKRSGHTRLGGSLVG